MCRVVDGEWMELTPDMMVHNKRSVIKWVEKHTAHYRSTGVKFENALDWVTQTRYGKSASEISTALGLGGSVRVSTPASLAGACRAATSVCRCERFVYTDIARLACAACLDTTMCCRVGAGDFLEKTGLRGLRFACVSGNAPVLASRSPSVRLRYASAPVWCGVAGC
jgi:hypothetical protein